jgi:hypothetical protein
MSGGMNSQDNLEVHMRNNILLYLTTGLALTGCVAAPPSGPSVMVMPGTGKTFTAFQTDDAACRGAAAQSIGYASPAQAANQAAVGSAAVGTALGAAAGAAIGAAAGNPGAGAAIGAGTGLIAGSAVGAGNAQASAQNMQFRYNTTYLQCMAADGNKVPPPPPAVTYVPSPGVVYDYDYWPYPPPYAYYPGYGYLYPPVGIIIGGGYGHWGWHGGWGGGWHGGGPGGWHR